MIESIFKYGILIVGCVMVGLAFHHQAPVGWNGLFNIIGIILMIHAITFGVIYE